MTSSVASEPISVVSPAIVGFLTRFAVALHKMRAYPAGHPMRQDAIELAHAELAAVLVGRESIQVAVARSQLLVDGRPTDPAHFVLRDLAARLHRLGLGAVVFRPAVTAEELGAALQQLIVDPSRPDERGVIRTFTSSRNVELLPMSFRALSLDRTAGGDGSSEEGEVVERLWRDLAALVLHGGGDPDAESDGGGVGGGAGLLVGPRPLAQALLDRIRSGQVPAESMGEAIERVGRIGATLDGEARGAIELRLRDLLATLPEDALAALLSIRLDSQDGLDRLAGATDWLPATALLELVETAAKAQKHEISTFMIRLLRKLGGQGGAPQAPRREGPDFRGVIRQIVEGWSLESPNPAAHTRILDLLAMQDQGAGIERSAGEGLRLVQMALETGAVGDQVAEGVELVVEAGDLPVLMPALTDPSADPEAADAVWTILTRQEVMERVLHAANVDLTAATALVARLGADQAERLIDLAVGAEDAAIRRLLIERVVGFGAIGGAALRRRLEIVPPAGQRLLLATLADCPSLPPGLDLGALVVSPEPMVRLEALRVMLRSPAGRSEAIHLGLSDSDDRVVRLVVDAAHQALPRQSLSRLMLLLSNPRRSPELQARAVPILAQFDAPSVRQWLYDGMIVRKGWFRRTRLVPKSPLMVAKLALIASRWPDDPETRRLARLARRTGDVELVAAAGQETA